MKRENGARIMGLFVSFLWGLSFLSIKVALGALPPMTLAFARFLISVAILPLIAALMRESLRIRLRDLPLLSLGGLVGVTLYFACENSGVQLLSASEASLIIGVIPVATMLAERVFLKTRLRFRSYIGAILSFAGVALIAARSPGAVSSPMGFVYMVGAALSWVVYSFVTKPLSASYGRVCITFWQSAAGLAGFVPFMFAEHPRLGVLGPAIWLNVLFLGIFCSAIGFWFYIVSLDVLGAGPSSAFINLIPVVSVVAAYFILGDRLNALQLAGGAAAVIGVYLATASAGPREQSRREASRGS
jgi:drug/metabolite transporter (DMT)-like permease